MNPNTPDTPLDITPVSPEPTTPLTPPEITSIGDANSVEQLPSSTGENIQEVSSSETSISTLSDTDGSSAESSTERIAPEDDLNTKSAISIETIPIEASSSAILNSPEVLSTPSVTNVQNTPAGNTPDTPKKGKGLLFGILGVLGISLLGGVSFAGYTYYERVTHPDWTASEIGVFIRDGVIDSLTSHAMILSGSEPTFTTINTNYALSGEGKGLEMTGFKNANATLNMSGSAYMEPLVASGSLPVFDGSFTMTLSLEGSGDKGMKGSLAIGVDAKSTGDMTLYIRPNSIKLVAPDISDISKVFDVPIGSRVPFQEINTLNNTYLGKWYRIDLKQAGEELPKLVSEISGIPYGIPTESLDTENFIKQQQEAEKQMKEHLGKLKAIFDKHTLIKATARDTGWKSYLNPRSITYDASLDQEGLSALILDSYDWLKDVPVGEGKTVGVMYGIESLNEEEKGEFQKVIKGITFEFTLSGDMKKHGDMELKKFTFHEDESSPIFALHDFMKTKIDRDENVIKVAKNGSLCEITETQSGTTKSLCEKEGYSKPNANFTYTANATLAPQNFSLSGNIDVFPYDYEKKNFNDKAAHITIDTQVVTNENTANKFSQKMNLNVGANLEQANTKVKFSLDGLQTTEKVVKRTINPVSESIDVLEMIKNPPLKGNVPIISYADISKYENSDIQVQVQSDASAHSNNVEYQTLAEKLSSCTSYQSQFEHPFTGEIMERKILGIVNGKCSYIESMPTNGKMECNYTDDQRTAAAQYYKDMIGVNPLQTFMNDGTCVITPGY